MQRGDYAFSARQVYFCAQGRFPNFFCKNRLPWPSANSTFLALNEPISQKYNNSTYHRRQNCCNWLCTEELHSCYVNLGQLYQNIKHHTLFCILCIFFAHPTFFCIGHAVILKYRGFNLQCILKSTKTA